MQNNLEQAKLFWNKEVAKCSVRCNKMPWMRWFNSRNVLFIVMVGGGEIQDHMVKQGRRERGWKLGFQGGLWTATLLGGPTLTTSSEHKHLTDITLPNAILAQFRALTWIWCQYKHGSKTNSKVGDLPPLDFGPYHKITITETMTPIGIYF